MCCARHRRAFFSAGALSCAALKHRACVRPQISAAAHTPRRRTQVPRQAAWPRLVDADVAEAVLVLHCVQQGLDRGLAPARKAHCKRLVERRRRRVRRRRRRHGARARARGAEAVCGCARQPAERSWAAGCASTRLRRQIHVQHKLKLAHRGARQRQRQVRAVRIRKPGSAVGCSGRGRPHAVDCGSARAAFAKRTQARRKRRGGSRAAMLL